jgi:hypothetical protein
MVAYPEVDLLAIRLTGKLHSRKLIARGKQNRLPTKRHDPSTTGRGTQFQHARIEE